jgi:LysM repeat protein
MNLVGKIFVMLIFAMSLVFMAFSISVYATHTNYRNEILKPGGYKAQLEDQRKNNQRLQDERNKFELIADAEKTAKIQALAKAEAEINRLKSDYAKVNQELVAKSSDLEKNTVALKAAQDGLSRVTEEVGKLRTEIASAQTETSARIKQAIELQDQMTVAKGQLTVLTERNQQLTTDVAKARNLLSAVGRKLEDPLDVSKIPVSGLVKAVSRSRVELSIGADDGVRIGQELDIKRGDKYVGRVKISEAKPDIAVGTILTEYTQSPIQRGDNVTSGL